MLVDVIWLVQMCCSFNQSRHCCLSVMTPFFMPFFFLLLLMIFSFYFVITTHSLTYIHKKNLTTIVRYDFLQKIFFVKLSVNGETGLLALLIIVVHQLCYTRPHCSYIELLSLLSRSNWWRSASTVCVAVKAASATWNRHWSMLFVPLSSKALKSMDLALIFTR